MKLFVALARTMLLGTAAAKTGALVEPLRMSDVALAGDWKEAEVRNQEVSNPFCVQLHRCVFAAYLLVATGASVVESHRMVMPLHQHGQHHRLRRVARGALGHVREGRGGPHNVYDGARIHRLRQRRQAGRGCDRGQV
jgi:hypothetical protein